MISDLKFAAYYLLMFRLTNGSCKFFNGFILVSSWLISYRMEGRHNFLHHLNDVRIVLVTCLCQLCQLTKEFTDVKRNRLTNVNQVIICLLHALFCHQLLFINEGRYTPP